MNKKLLVLGALACIIIAGIWFYPVTREKTATGTPMVKVNVPADLADVAEGKLAFDGNCASCHGKNASGSNGNGPPLIHKIYKPGHHGDMSFVLAAKNGTRAHHWKFGDMPPVEDISDTEVKKIIAYVRKLQRANGIN